MSERRSRPGPTRRHDSRIYVVCPGWLKERLEEEADREERPMSELIRERLAAPYRRERQESQG